MSNVNFIIEKIESHKSLFIYVDDILNKDEFTYAEVVSLINKLVENTPKTQFIECEISSETEVIDDKQQVMASSLVDTEWSMPAIKISENMIWYPKENEVIIPVEELSETLVAIYYVQSDEYYLTIVSKDVFYNRRISESVLNLIYQISSGDMVLLDKELCIEKKEFKEVIDYLVNSGYAFIVHKNLVDNVESIKIESAINWEKKENYSIEFTKKGRRYYADNKLGLELMRFIYE